MKNINRKKVLGLSVVAALFIGTGVDAGKIVTNASYNPPGVTSSATAEVNASQQFGFGGWDLTDVVVKIVSIFNFNLALPGYTFDENTGLYTPMDENKSFESEISTGAEVRGLLHGKNWPVGEPSGIKIINDDLHVQHGKPENCIINSSYLEGFYLDSPTPQPVICSSDFQTHKRFKINMLDTTVDNLTTVGNVSPSDWGKPIDMVFNLEPGQSDRQRYQMFQKINNYTGKRLDGYKVEVLNASGNAQTADLNISLGISERTNGSNPTPIGDIFEFDGFATFSDGLWGPIDYEHDRPRGFFDDNTAYFKVPIAAHHTSQIVGGTDGFLGANYKALFGDWLPSIWAPKGIFYDFDNDPLTDDKLMAFFGTIPGEYGGTPGWHKGEEEGWATPTAQEMLAWNGPLYRIDTIEDVLNLGINYIVEVGDNDGLGGQFIIRITPHVASDQTAPTYAAVTPAFPEDYNSSVGMVSIMPAPTFEIGHLLTIAVGDTELNTNQNSKDYVDVNVTSSKGERELLRLNETDVNSSIFTGMLQTVSSATAGANDDGNISVEAGTSVTVTYDDAGVIRTASTYAAVAPTAATASSDGGGGGFDVLDNPSLIAMILGFLGIGAFIARRKLAKKA